MKATILFLKMLGPEAQASGPITFRISTITFAFDDGGEGYQSRRFAQARWMRRQASSSASVLVA